MSISNLEKRLLTKEGTPSMEDLTNMQIVSNASTDDLIAELTNRVQKEITGVNVYRTIFTDIKTNYLAEELSERKKIISEILTAIYQKGTS